METDIKRIIKEIIEEQSELDEGFLDRIAARVSGNTSKLKALGKNVGKIYRGVTTGSIDSLSNPKVVKAMSIGAKRIQSYEIKLSKVFKDMVADLELIFGESFETAPPQLKNAINDLDEESVKFMGAVSAIGKVVNSFLSSANTGEKSFKEAKKPYNDLTKDLKKPQRGSNISLTKDIKTPKRGSSPEKLTR